MKIQVIQLKRGAKLDLERLLVGAQKPAAGEPIFESDTNKLKIGNGIDNYINLPYVAGGDIIIEDALDGQILMYSEAEAKWKAVDLADGQSIEYGQDGLKIAGFSGDPSQNGLFPMANNGGITWQQPVSPEEIDAAIRRAKDQADRAEQEATTALGAAVRAEAAAANTEAFAEQTAELYNNKFWYGTYSQYMTDVIGAGKLTEGTIYFISDNPGD